MSLHALQYAVESLLKASHPRNSTLLSSPLERAPCTGARRALARITGAPAHRRAVSRDVAERVLLWEIHEAWRIMSAHHRNRAAPLLLPGACGACFCERQPVVMQGAALLGVLKHLLGDDSLYTGHWMHCQIQYLQLFLLLQDVRNDVSTNDRMREMELMVLWLSARALMRSGRTISPFCLKL